MNPPAADGEARRVNTPHIEYRILSDVEDLQRVVDLEIVVWGMDPRDAVPVNIMRAMSLHGGLATGAYDGDRIVGMTLAFPARAYGRWVLWSHMAAVHPDYQRQGIGFALKQQQRDWALAHGFNEICWTFDPLQRGNANFNLRLLGVTASVYHVNYYGEMSDAINRNDASDRIEARWKLRDRRVKQLAVGQRPPAPPPAPSPDTTILRSMEDGKPCRADIRDGCPWLYAQIPCHRSALAQDALPAWRIALRETLQEAFARGYVAVDFVETETGSYYALRGAQPWYLYVLECSDGTFHTGVTPNVEARVRRHQAGKGAAYTAMRRPVRLLAVWKCRDRSAALKAELAFKGLTRAAKLSAVASEQPFEGASFQHVEDFA